MKKITVLFAVSLMLLLTACSSKKFRIIQTTARDQITNYEYYDSGKIKTIEITDKEGNQIFIKNFAENGKLDSLDVKSPNYPSVGITGAHSFSRKDSEVGFDYDTEVVLRADGQTKKQVMHFNNGVTVTNTYVYDRSGLLTGSKSDDGKSGSKMKIRYDYDYDENGNPVTCYQLYNDERSFVYDMVCEQY